MISAMKMCINHKTYSNQMYILSIKRSCMIKYDYIQLLYTLCNYLLIMKNRIDVILIMKNESENLI